MSDLNLSQNFQLNKLASLLSLIQVCPSNMNSLLQSLQMDTSCYQTLQHLKTQNQNVKDQSDSAMYLWKQTNKLISFIDQRKSNQSNHTINHRKLYFNKVQTQYRQQQQQQKLDIQDVKIDRVKSFIKIKQHKIKHLNKQPALIKQQNTSISIKTLPNQVIQFNQSKQQPNHENINVQNENQNTINSSNIQEDPIKLQKQFKPLKQITIFNKNKAKLTKKKQQTMCKYPLQCKRQQYLLGQQVQKEQVIQQKQIKVSEIRRPQYQRTELIKIKYNKNNKNNLRQPNYEQTNIMSSQQSQTQKSQVKLLRIQTQYYQNTQDYKQECQLQKQAFQSQKQALQSQKQGAQSQATNANSRLSNFTNKSNLQQNNSILYNQTLNNNIQTLYNNNQKNTKRSLSPKVQGKKKIVVKLSTKNSTRQKNIKQQKQQNNGQIKQQNNRQIKDKYNQQPKFGFTKPLQTHRFNQQDSQQSQLQSEFLNCPSTQNLPQHQQIYVSKTMKLIRKNSNKILPKVNSKCFLNIISNQDTKNVVPQEEPWQCEEIQLQEQLKAIDQEIMSRKSLNITKKQQYNQYNHQLNHQNNHQNSRQFNNHYNHQYNERISYQPYNKRERIYTLQDQTPRNNAGSGYDQYLFTQNYESYKSNFLQQQTYQYQRQQKYNKQKEQRNEKEIRNETHEPKVVRLSLTPLLNQKRNKSPNTSRPSTNRKAKSPLR